MKIYILTENGNSIARSVNHPDTPGWRVVHYLDRAGKQTSDDISRGTGLDANTVGSTMGSLRRKGIVAELSEV